MDKKPELVIFTSNNARIIHADPSEWPTALVNPDRSAVTGVKPHHWKLVDGKLVEMSPPEKQARKADHAQRGVDNDIERYRVRKGEATKVEMPKRRMRMPSKAFWIGLAGAAAGYLAHWLQ